MTAEPLTPEEAARAVIDTWRGQRSHMPVAIRDLEVALDAARKAPPPLDVERLASELHVEWDRRTKEASEPGVPCPDCIDSAQRILAALDPTP